MLRVEFWLLAHGPRKQGRKAGLAGGMNKILEFQHFSQKTPLKLATGQFLFYAAFWFETLLANQKLEKGFRFQVG